MYFFRWLWNNVYNTVCYQLADKGILVQVDCDNFQIRMNERLPNKTKISSNKKV